MRALVCNAKSCGCFYFSNFGPRQILYLTIPQFRHLLTLFAICSDVGVTKPLPLSPRFVISGLCAALRSSRRDLSPETR